MATEVEWTENPWRRPSAASVQAILKRLGLGQDGERVDPDVAETLTTEDNQVLSAGGVFFDPVQPVKGADYSLFNGVVAEGNGDKIVYHVFKDGEEIAKRTGDGLLDTVELWNEVAG